MMEVGVARWPVRAFAVLLLLIGAGIALGGARLLSLGGSSYYLIGGVVVAVSAIAIWRLKEVGPALYAAFLLATLIWAVAEVGMNGWGLAPRLIGPGVIGLIFVFPTIRRHFPHYGKAAAGIGLIAVLMPAGVGLMTPDGSLKVGSVQAIATDQPGLPGEWQAFGRNAAGTRFSPLDQITADNVAQLMPAWTYHTGVVQKGPVSPLQATPLMVGDSLYLCTQTNIVVALDPETGKERWRYDPKVDPTGASAVTTCRGVAYHKVSAAPAATGAVVECPERIITATFDARLIALDARTGRLCPSFGKGGTVDLRAGMGKVDAGFYYISSAPTIVRGNIVLGGWVADNQSVDEPSGVIRGFDVLTGALNWAWDAGNPANAKGPAAGGSYSRSTPNSWAPMSADEVLGLVYVPTGNPTPDHFGGLRSAASEQFGSSVVALDAATGALRWSFQTAHHDLWDYDVASQPTLVDVPVNGAMVPGLVQATKRGELFLLDRRTGTPIAPVEERAAPQRGAVKDERLARTQPYSVGMPSFSGPPLTESDMWGVTPIDQLWCRIRFRSLRYDGHATPPGLDEALIYPSIGGGMNWGGVAVDPDRGVMIVNTMNYGTIIQLVPRADADRILNAAKGQMHNFNLPLPQAGTPYGVRLSGLVSPLNTPCNAPPFGELHAIDLKTRTLLWSRSIGTAQDAGPNGLSIGLPIPMGMPNFGGALTTRSGLTFIGAVREKAFRAFDTATGRELWRARLPASANANPMTYVSPKSGRQFVVVAASGHVMLQSPLSDTFVAFALPQKL